LEKANKSKCELVNKWENIEKQLFLINQKLDWILSHVWDKDFIEAIETKIPAAVKINKGINPEIAVIGK